MTSEQLLNKKYVDFAKKAISEMIPRFEVLLSVKKSENNYATLEMVEVELKAHKRNVRMLKDLNGELEHQLDTLRNTMKPK